MKTSAKSAFVDGLTALMLENPDEMLIFLWQLIQRAMVMSIMSQLKASLDSNMGHIEQELLQGSCMQVGTNEGANPTGVAGAVKVAG